ncbi:MAG: GlsB/YeaQ/YmgE family stress response membrane protein [Candidatus Obscuribacterales bacterium]|nr:GlsB/YeaQ/YmgE family stress response membrane protein [Candidatus Obscuribacterales bacterium]
MSGFLFYLCVASMCAFIAERIVPGGRGGFFMSTIVGMIGAWIGSSIFAKFGPSLAGVALLPCALGSALLLLALSLCRRRFKGR